MFRPALSQTPTFKLIVGLGLCTVGGAMLYAYFKIRDDDEENSNRNLETTKLSAVLGKKGEEKEISMKLVIKTEHIALLVGRNGQNIPLIEEKTNTRIRFRDKDSSHKFCDIDGLPANVKMARDLIFKEIEKCPIVKEEMFVPQSVCGKIMGRCGEAMQEICRKSLAKITIDSGGSHSTDKRRLIITGNQQQVNIARKLIEEKIQEEEELRQAVEEVEHTREPRRSPTNSLTSSLYSSQTSLSSHLAPKDKLVNYSNENKTMEVYVSAIASPSKFWIQLVGPQTKKLDSLVKEMTEYYDSEENRKLHKIREPYLGQIVAAIFRYDGKWYRAEIVGILPNEVNPGEVILDLYFVDYGDSEYVGTYEVYELRTDFLTLRFQAVECFLANVKPSTPNDTGLWPQSAIKRFEELTDVACWKKLIARVVTYKERPRPADNAVQYGSNREGTPIPGIELYDNTDGLEISVGHSMISSGSALPIDGTYVDPALKSNSNTPTNSPTPSPVPPSVSTTSSTQISSPVASSVSPLPTIIIPEEPSSKTFYKDHRTNPEDALFQSQIEHLAKKNNSFYTNSDGSDSISSVETPLLAQAKNEFLNGNYKGASEMASLPSKNLNGNLIA